jgi:hypothetical protein
MTLTLFFSLFFVKTSSEVLLPEMQAGVAELALSGRRRSGPLKAEVCGEQWPARCRELHAVIDSGGSLDRTA